MNSKFIALVIGLLAPASVWADTTIHLRVVTPTATLYDNTLTVASCPISAATSSESTSNGKCALEQANLFPTWNWYGDDGFIDTINTIANDTASGSYWGWFENTTLGATALNKHILHDGEYLLIILGLQPLSFSVASSTLPTGATTTLSVQEFGYDASWNPVWSASPNAHVSVGTSTYTTDASGTALIIAPFGTTTIHVHKDGFVDPLKQTIIGISTDSTATNASSTTGAGGSSIIIATSTATTTNATTASIVHTPLDTQKALGYLLSQQRLDGSFGSDLYTDWAAMALASAHANLSSIKGYEITHTPILSSVTDYERHAMALSALDINPYNGTAVDTITPIVKAFDGTQIGDSSLINDDIFGILALSHAGYTSYDPIIQKTAAYIISKQQSDGSWEHSIDMTAAAMQALGPLYDITGANTALARAIQYAISQQQDIGGWSNIDSSSWMVSSINLFDSFHMNKAGQWNTASGYFPSDALGRAQVSDGAVRPVTDPLDTRVWSTSYALFAASGGDWIHSLQNVSKQLLGNGGTGGNSVMQNTSQTTASTTAISTATTTALSIATTTPLVPQILGTSTSITTVPVVPLQSITHILPRAVKKITKKVSSSISIPKKQTASPSIQTQVPTITTNAIPPTTSETLTLWQRLVRFVKGLF